MVTGIRPGWWPTDDIMHENKRRPLPIVQLKSEWSGQDWKLEFQNIICDEILKGGKIEKWIRREKKGNRFFNANEPQQPGKSRHNPVSIRLCLAELGQSYLKIWIINEEKTVRSHRV